jgi:hypothetical protein
MFFTEAKHILDGGDTSYPPNILALRERLHASPVTNISFISCNGGHFTAQAFEDGVLSYADSMGNPVLDDVLPMFSWLLDGLHSYERPSFVHEKKVPLQARAMGSCGVASLSFIESLIDPTVSSWTDATSTLHCNTALHNLILYHLISVDVPGVSFIQPYSSILLTLLLDVRTRLGYTLPPMAYFFSL